MKKALFLIAMAAMGLTAGEVSFKWTGKSENIPSRPKIEEITEDDWVSIRCTPTAAGPWQGMVGTPASAVALTGFKGVSFDIRQKCYPGNCATVIYIHTDKGNFYHSFNAGNGQDWVHVEIPFETAKWQGSDKSGFDGKITRIIIYPYQALNAPSKYIEIANFELIPAE
ncbi:MAG: hypothetical protein IKC94_04315 [Lentisphaeria bacterium]|nr:hypothetical protein [Lentisphaeria bacterium]